MSGTSDGWQQEVRERLDGVTVPGFRHSLVRYGLVQDLRKDGNEIVVALLSATTRPEVAAEIRKRVVSALADLPGVSAIRVTTVESPRDPATAASSAQGGAQTPEGIPGVGVVIAVSSCKGGVGKSTVAANLACALRQGGIRVGLLDADVYGPSVPMMMGAAERPHAVNGKVAPLERHGVSLMSMGFFLDDRSPVIWRGPMVMGLIRQFLRDVEWGSLDVLVVDMPPGTGDAALTLAQQVPLGGAVIVTTPQEVALADVERGIAMFRQVQVPILGIVENMAGYVCPDCGEHDDVFGSGGAESLAKQFGVTVLARIPLVPAIRESGDEGTPIVLAAPDHAVAESFRNLAGAVRQALEAAAAASAS